MGALVSNTPAAVCEEPLVVNGSKMCPCEETQVTVCAKEGKFTQCYIVVTLKP